MEKYINDCASFIEASSTPFHAIDELKKQFLERNFIELKENNNWNLEKGKSYFVIRNLTSIIAFKIGQNVDNITFNLCASHSDVCSFKVKPETTLHKNGYVQLNTEGYGGMICSTWLDRPLSIAGRVMVNQDGKVSERLFDFKEPTCLIPNMAIHMNRSVNEDMKYNKQVDMLPMIGLDQKEFNFKSFLANKIGVNEEALSFYDAFLYNPEKCLVWGENKQFFSGQRLDDLQMAYASMEGFVQANNENSVNVYCCFDNEEVGSRTRQGAASTFLKEVLKRINFGLGKNQDDFYSALASSFMVSCDNAHALHPNHPEKADELNRPKINQGIVVKFNAAQSYTSDALSAAYFKAIATKANVPCQTFTNRSDLVGGGTLGNVSATQVSIPTVDIGLAQLAMHSTYETGGSTDIKYTVDVMREFFNATIVLDDEGAYIL